MDLKKLYQKNERKIVLLVFDGLGGIPTEEDGLTELEKANIPNLDEFAKKGICGRMIMVEEGITPGSGPGHFSLFGYDPVKTEIGRGVLESLGVGLEIQKGDLCARGNFATMNEEGIITDRRAGGITTEKNKEICEVLNRIKIDGVQIIVKPGKEHRFVLLLRGEGLFDSLSETDPQKTGVPPHRVEALNEKSEKSSFFVNNFIEEAHKILKNYYPANTILLRGFANPPQICSFEEKYGLKPCAIATYPMYKGIAKLLGMDVKEAGVTFKEEIDCLEREFANYDFFYIHVKETDTAGHAGDFERKRKVLENCDLEIPRIFKLNPDVFIVTGDHSTPPSLKEHSWHPVPVAMISKNEIPDLCEKFTEREFMKGSMGIFHGTKLIQIAMANAGKLLKFRA